MRAPGDRAETLECMEKLKRQKELSGGVQFALIEQAFLISDEGELVLSPLTFSIALRAYVGMNPIKGPGEFPTLQCVAEFVMQPRQLLQGHAVMRALTPKERRYETGQPECFAGGIKDPFEPSRGYITPRLKQCSNCHGGWPRKLGFQTASPQFVKEGKLEAISKATSARKRDDETWKALHEFLQADSAQ